MKKMLAIIPLLAAGCTTVQDVQNMSTAGICYAVLTGRTRGLYEGVYWTELSRRSEDCTGYQQMVQSRLQAEAASNAAMNNALTILQQAQPKPVTPLTRDCTSYISGNVVRTSCF